MMHASLKMQVTKCCVCVHVQVDGTLTEQEVMTVARYFSNQGQQPGMDAQKLVAIAQEQLRKRNYESFNNLLESLQHQDRTKWVRASTVWCVSGQWCGWVLLYIHSVVCQWAVVWLSVALHPQCGVSVGSGVVECCFTSTVWCVSGQWCGWVLLYIHSVVCQWAVVWLSVALHPQCGVSVGSGVVECCSTSTVWCVSGQWCGWVLLYIHSVVCQWAVVWLSVALHPQCGVSVGSGVVECCSTSTVWCVSGQWCGWVLLYIHSVVCQWAVVWLSVALHPQCGVSVGSGVVECCFTSTVWCVSGQWCGWVLLYIHSVVCQWAVVWLSVALHPQCGVSVGSGVVECCSTSTVWCVSGQWCGWVLLYIHSVVCQWAVVWLSVALHPQCGVSVGSGVAECCFTSTENGSRHCPS